MVDQLACTLILEMNMGNRTFQLLQPSTIYEVWGLLKQHFGLPVILTLSGGVARATYI